MEAGLLVIVFVAGFLTGFSVGERRWKKSAFEALDLLDRMINDLRRNTSKRGE
ncbi:hypothetical protein [Bosea sp. NBC_00550]|uniref:hypothetical protein n=1 Tax=Bosea sp. NBC_00550 TaxID=2969621 RepID=UPI0022312323|nr:hypothetical protein [Bosea sp. NBC_00550]UZF95531.1 hypothetical protein NWE53_29070 [Bosea sp. NBC_00550]